MASGDICFESTLRNVEFGNAWWNQHWIGSRWDQSVGIQRPMDSASGSDHKQEEYQAERHRVQCCACRAISTTRLIASITTSGWSISTE